jgi:hypothetical protein
LILSCWSYSDCAQFADGVLSVEVAEALPNCPKYIQARVPEAPPFPVSAKRQRRGEPATALSAEQAQRVAECDTFFLGTCFGRADTTHRGGRPGFVRVLAGGAELRWGECVRRCCGLWLTLVRCRCAEQVCSVLVPESVSSGIRATI